VKIFHLFFFIVFIVFAQSAATAEEPTLNEILQKHLEAMGGLRNWSQVESIRLSGTIERDGQTVDIVIIKKRPNQIRATVTIPLPNDPDNKVQIIRAHDGKNAWTATRLAGNQEMVKKPITGQDADDLLADAGVLPPLIGLWRGGEKITLIDSDSFEGESAFVIEVKANDESHKQRFYLSTDSFRTIGRVTYEPTGITKTILSDYQENGGVYLPSCSLITAQSTGQSKMQTQSIKIGVGIYEEYFEVGDTAQTADL
jgi:outer membrane lipoprotein-sorting protein